jgi:hypothetical protein
VTVSADVVKDWTVPALGTQIALSGKVKDARGGAIKPFIDASAKTLSDAAVAGNRFFGNVHGNADGSYKLNILPGVYNVRITAE